MKYGRDELNRGTSEDELGREKVMEESWLISARALDEREKVSLVCVRDHPAGRWWGEGRAL